MLIEEFTKMFHLSSVRTDYWRRWKFHTDLYQTALRSQISQWLRDMFDLHTSAAQKAWIKHFSYRLQDNLHLQSISSQLFAGVA